MLIQAVRELTLNSQEKAAAVLTRLGESGVSYRQIAQACQSDASYLGQWRTNPTEPTRDGERFINWARLQTGRAEAKSPVDADGDTKME